MLLTVILCWAIGVPAVVVGGLLIASSILGRRARRSGVVKATGMARELGRLAAATPDRADGSAGDASSPERRRVGAAY